MVLDFLPRIARRGMAWPVRDEGAAVRPHPGPFEVPNGGAQTKGVGHMDLRDALTGKPVESSKPVKRLQVAYKGTPTDLDTPKKLKVVRPREGLLRDSR